MRRIFCVLVISAVLCGAAIAGAQQQAKIPRVDFIHGWSRPTSSGDV